MENGHDTEAQQEPGTPADLDPTGIQPPALPVNVKELVRFPCGERVYSLRHWTPPMRNQLSELLLATCGYPVTDEEMDEATRAAIAEVYDAESQAEQCALLDERDGRAVAIKSGEEVPQADMDAMNAKLRRLERVLSRGSSEYAALLAQRQRWHNTFGFLVVRLTVRRWEGLTTPVELQRGLPTLECLAAIPADDLRPLADQAAAMMSLSELHRKN